MSTLCAQAPIGVFDSGLGGLSVLRDIRAQLPGEALLYLADSLYAPYGDKPEAQIQARTIAICDWLISQQVKAIVVACNTATTRAIHLLRERYRELPIIGVEPGLKPAASQSATHVVGVLATRNTLASDKFSALLAAQDPSCRFVCVAGTGLVEFVENGDTQSPALIALLREQLAPMLDAGADTLVLGCTHYPFLLPAINAVTGGRLAVIDTGAAVARRLVQQLDAHGLRAPETTAPAPTRYLSTFDAGHLQQRLADLLGEHATATTVTIEARDEA